MMPMSTLLIFLPTIIISIIYAIPCYLTVKNKGYTGILWLLFCIVPIVNLFSIMFVMGLPDKILRSSLLELVELKKEKLKTTITAQEYV